MVTKITETGSTIGIRTMIGMIIKIIQTSDRIMIGMITSGTIVMIRVEMTIDNMIIEGMTPISGSRFLNTSK